MSSANMTSIKLNSSKNQLYIGHRSDPRTLPCGKSTVLGQGKE